MRRLQICLRWLTAAAVVLALMLLAWQCLDIYIDGNAPENLDPSGVHILSVYRMTDVTARLKAISMPLTVCVALIVVTCVLHLLYPDAHKERVSITPENRLRLLRGRVSEMPASAVAEERRRRVIQLVSAVVIVVCGVFSLNFLLKKEHFTSWDLESVMGEMMLHVAPWVAVAFAVAAAASMLCRASIQREIILLKNIAAAQKPAASTPRQTCINWVRAAILTFAIVFIVLGVMNGGLRDVLVKAINICTECIGLG